MTKKFPDLLEAYKHVIELKLGACDFAIWEILSQKNK